MPDARFTPPLLLVLALALAAGCARAPGAGRSEVQTLSLRPGQSARLADGARLTFANQVNESRCPTGTTCAWAGTATIRLVLFTLEGEALDVLAVIPGGVGREDVAAHLPAEAAGYTVTLLELAPHPTADDAGPAEAPRALVRVQRRGP